MSSNINLFVDANILLDFYGLSSADLDELEITLESFEAKSVSPHINSHLVDEVARNRTKVLHSALLGLRNSKPFNIDIPKVCREFDSFNSLDDAIRQGKAALTKLIKSFEESAVNESLRGDDVIEKYLQSSSIDQITSELIDRARLRNELGHPPQSENKRFGDQIHWLYLLDVINKGEDLHLVSGDSGFFSHLTRLRPNPYLEEEWKFEKQSNLHIYPSLRTFIGVHFPDIKQPGDFRRNRIIESIKNISSFQETHSVLRGIKLGEDYSVKQVRALVKALCENSQISWISSDNDVADFARDIYGRYQDQIGEDLLWQFEAAYALADNESSVSAEAIEVVVDSNEDYDPFAD